MDEELVKVYIKINENNCVTDVNSSIFLSDTMDWIQIDEGIGDKYALAESNYFDTSIEIQPLIYRYKYVDGVVLERTVEEIQGDVDKIVVPLSEMELLKAQLQAETERGEFMEDVIAEMAMLFY